jgi:hypothetical protein
MDGYYHATALLAVAQDKPRSLIVPFAGNVQRTAHLLSACSRARLLLITAMAVGTNGSRMRSQASRSSSAPVPACGDASCTGHDAPTDARGWIAQRQRHKAGMLLAT